MSSSPLAASAESDSELREFLLWILAALGCDCHCEDGEVVVDHVSEPLQTRFGEETVRRFALSSAESSNGTPLVTVDSPIVRSLIDELKRIQVLGRAVPADQPESVRDLSPRLFDAYQVDGGSVHLGGCTLEDRAILRITYVDHAAGPGSKQRLQHRFVSLVGQPLDASLVQSLGLERLVPPTRSIRVTDDQCERWQQIGEMVVAGLASEPRPELLLTTAVWCKYAEGKLEFVIGDATTSIPFSGWAQRLVDGSERPPALVCASHPQGSYHLAATDDGQIVPAEAIAVCCESGRRVLSSDLETCEATGAKALPEFFVDCPVNGTRVLRRTLVPCATCQQLVSPTACVANQCTACRSLTRVSKDDPRMARLLGEYPKLDRWMWWKLAETDAAYVLVASSLAKRLLIVVDKHDLAVLRLAKGSRLSNKWAETSDVDRTSLLR